MKNKMKRIYNGANFCPDCDDCPVIDLTSNGKMVIISDPAKPKNGKFKMTVDEYNILLSNAKKIK